ncbi:MAG TPA: DUF1302 family protein [Nevskiaceae bacterium]|nr:DUF1302 family protein [Nevskiaceae bacterium]
MSYASRSLPRLIVPVALAWSTALPAVELEFLDGTVTGTLNSTITLGGAIRMQDRAADLVGKANLNPDVCAGANQSCQGVFRDQVHPSQSLVAAPGAPTMRADDGNLSYDRHDFTQVVGKLTQDLSLTWGDYGLFARWLGFYDAVNADFEQVFPNRITAENVGSVGITGDNASANRYFDRVYGRGAFERERRREGEGLRQIGTDLQLLDLNVYGKLPLWGERELSWKLGRQTLNWGESTLLAINSLNQINPPNANNLYRTGFQVEEVFTPVGLVYLSTEPFYNATVELFYQYEWEPLEAPTPGSFLGFADIGSNNLIDHINLSFGGSADDPDGVGRFLNSPLSLITPTTAKATRGPDREPEDGGQFGLSFKYYAEEFNSGTELGFYFMNYHSRLPYVSFNALQASCARREGNPLGIDARNTAEFLQACPNIPVLTDAGARQQLQIDAVSAISRNPAILADLGLDPALLGNPAAALGVLSSLLAGSTVDCAGGSDECDDAVPLDTGLVFFEYPEDIQMYGFSFNTSFEDLALQGEIAYRPNLPLQVAIIDLEFASAEPALTRCHDASLGCAGTSGGTGALNSQGDRTLIGNEFGSSDFLDASGNNPYPDTINLLVGHVPGSARSFPSFVTAYRGQAPGETAPGAYIRGYERFDVLQYNLGGTQVLGATDNWVGADQVQLVFELGATHVPGLPSLDRLQIEAPGIYTHASAGADGSGADGSRQACAANPSCHVGPDGLRFNPTQANLDRFVDAFSWGYRLISIIKYESVFPGISFAPFILLGHDVNGTAPGPGENFVEGRKQAQITVEMRYYDSLSLNGGYAWFTGAGEANLYRDRDYAQFFLKYQF